MSQYRSDIKSVDPGFPLLLLTLTHTSRGSNHCISERKCFKCGKQGHIAPDCKGTRLKVPAVVCDAEPDSQSGGETADTQNYTACVVSQNLLIDSAPCNTSETLSSACHGKGDHMPIASGYVEGQMVTLLRDSGSRQIVVRKSSVDTSKLTGRFDTCVLADGRKRRVPIARVFLDTPYVVGEFDAWCMDQPIFDLIIGEVSGARQPHHPNPCWKPSLDSQTNRRNVGHTYRYKVPTIFIQKMAIDNKVQLIHRYKLQVLELWQSSVQSL